MNRNRGQMKVPWDEDGAYGWQSRGGLWICQGRGVVGYEGLGLGLGPHCKSCQRRFSGWRVRLINSSVCLQK